MTPTNFSLSGRAGAMVAIVFLASACGGSDNEGSGASKPDTKTFMTGYFQTFDAKVSDDILALYGENVTAEITGLGKLDGRDAVRDTWLTPFTTAFPDYSHTVSTLTATDGHASVDFVFEGTHQAPLLGFKPTGKSLVLPITGNYDVENEVVSNFKLEYDITIVFAAIQP